MALVDRSLQAGRRLVALHARKSSCLHSQARRCASTDAALDDIEQSSKLQHGYEVQIDAFDPAKTARLRKERLPPGRYGRYRPPKYYRGPLHPIQPPPTSDPHSRAFMPGPFSLSRIEQTYDSTIAPDILTISYAHWPPGFKPPPKTDRLRSWTGDSPYLKNRPPKGPPANRPLRPLMKPMDFTNIPKPTAVLVHTHVSDANDDSAWLHVTGAVIQAITNRRITPHKSKESVMQWGAKKGKFTAVTAEIQGEDMYDFLGRLVDIVLPRLKEWKGVSGASGDQTGNITLGLTPEAVATFPEIEVNIDSYPPKMIPGCHITIQTSATNDRDARVLCTALGIPFHGKFEN